MERYLKISQVYGKQVYTEEGVYLGKVEEAIIQDHSRVYGWKVRLENPKLGTTIKGIIVPHILVRAIGDIMLIAKVSLGTKENEEVKKVE